MRLIQKVKRNLEQADRPRDALAVVGGTLAAAIITEYVFPQNYPLGKLVLFTVLAAAVAATAGYFAGVEIERRAQKKKLWIAARAEYLLAGVALAIGTAALVFLAAKGVSWSPAPITGKPAALGWTILYAGCSVICFALYFKSRVWGAINAALAVAALVLYIASHDIDYLVLTILMALFSLPLLYKKH